MSCLRITLAQLNFTVGHIDHNVAQMCAAARQAYAQQADVVVFSELSLTGYWPGDLLHSAEFLQYVDDGIAKLLSASHETKGLHWVIGAPTHHRGAGKPLHNSLLVIADGKIVIQYAKQLLPTDNIFNERRHFEPGSKVAEILTLKGIKIGLMICEDGWNDNGDRYSVNPFEQLSRAHPDLVISINASPSSAGQREYRHTLFYQSSQRYQLPILYVNQIGGHDQLIFDGGSFATTPSHGIVFEAKRFTEDLTTLQFEHEQFYDTDGRQLQALTHAGISVMEFYYQQIILGLRDYMKRCHFNKVVVGSSGGIDSALTLALAAMALGAQHVTAITMPSAYSSTGSVSDSKMLCHHLSIRLIEHPIAKLVDHYSKDFAHAVETPLQGLALENLQARIRGTILMEYANSYDCLLLTTGNKSEISVGYCTLYGDTNGGLSLIGDLYKTEVFDLCRHINQKAGKAMIPDEIINKAPSAELAPEQQDSDSLPPYPILDKVLKHLIEAQYLHHDERKAVRDAFEQLNSTKAGQALITRVKQMIYRSEYKRYQMPPILRVRNCAFGFGRQMPIAAHYEIAGNITDDTSTPQNAAGATPC